METIAFLSRVFKRFLLFLFLLCICIRAENKDVKKAGRMNAGISYSKLNLNNISTFIFNDGLTDVDTNGNSGLIFPHGSSKSLAYISGLLWGAKIRDTVYVGGSAYTSGLQPGKIISPGIAEDPILPKNRIYRVRPDYKTAYLSIESNDEMKPEDEIRGQYERDWYEWPASDGAPFTDVDCDGKYNPETDIPGVKDALQTIWFVANDLNRDLNTTKSGIYSRVHTMGIEMQATFWTYDKDWILKNTYFRKYKLINKSKDVFKDMYIGQWANTEIGDLSNDYSGCDTVLNMGYSYNAQKSDEIYGDFCPAIGFDFVQGPLIKASATDSGIFNNRKVHGYKNLPMTSFQLYLNDCDCGWPNDPADYFTTDRNRLYKGLKGKIWIYEDGYTRIPPSLGGGETRFPASGDPIAGTGYIDGILLPMGDRGILLSSGPFEMAPGDTQEVVIAGIAAQSSSNLGSVGLLKQFSKEVQKRYDGLFDFPPVIAPSAPYLSAAYAKNEIKLDWRSSPGPEDFNEEGYKFQGYNVYQLSCGVPDKSFAKKIAVFDIADGITSVYGESMDTLTGNPVSVCQQQGTDSGIKRALSLKSDSFTNSNFLIGKKYYFGVSAYTYRNDPAGKLTNTESPIRVVPVVFQDSLPGLKYSDTLRVARISGISQKTIVPVVIDASKITGHEYQIGFTGSGDTLPRWYLKDLTLDQLILKDQQVITADSSRPSFPLIDGVQIIVIDAPWGMKEWKVTSGSLKWSGGGANPMGFEGFNGAIGNAHHWFNNSLSSPNKLPHTLIKFAATDTLGNLLDANDPDASYAYRYLRNAIGAPSKPEFTPYIKNPAAGYAYQDYTKSLPFAAYNYETGQRLMAGYLENNSANGRIDGKYWPPSGTEPYMDNYSASGPREWFFIFDVPYSETPSLALMTDILNNSTPMLWAGIPARNSNASFGADDEFLIIKNNLFTAGDVFTFKTDYLTSFHTGEIPGKFELLQNYPNPFNPLTTINYQLPERAFVELRIFDMLGREVTTLISKEQPAGRYKTDFNGSGLSSGIYIYRLKAGSYISSRKFILLK